MRYWKPIVVLLVIAAAAGAYVVYSNRESTFDIATATVDAGPVTMTIETLGNIEPLSNVIVGCEVTGRIIQMPVGHDDPVKKDQIICRIDPELADADHQKSLAEKERTRSLVNDATVALEEQKANLPILTEQAKQQWEVAKSSLELMKFNWERTDKLYTEGNAPELEWTNAKSNHAQAVANERITEAQFRQAQNNEKFVPQRLEQALEQAKAAADLAAAQFKTTEARVERCTIRSPIDGIVLKRFEDVGNTVIAALATPPLFLIAPSLDRLRVNAKVSETDIVHVDEGQRSYFKVEGKQTADFEGEILHKRNHPEIVQGVTTYTVSMQVSNDERRTLLPGMSINVVIECEKRDNVLRIPNAALRFKPPLSALEVRTILEAVKHPPEPRTADGKRMNYCTQEYAWEFDRLTRAWNVAPLWVGITDNVYTEVLAGAEKDDKFVTRFEEKTSGGFSFKDALRQANPADRSI
ncbi:MAG TPA: efflux RND transporter periplasmic adaptor subunit [Phycisphaerae bacterium]|nr:efflux RND transporter periplasmic adaptor subunit [Phycisphaerae bacterium]